MRTATQDRVQSGITESQTCRPGPFCPGLRKARNEECEGAEKVRARSQTRPHDQGSYGTYSKLRMITDWSVAGTAV